MVTTIGEWTLTWHTEGETQSQWHQTAIGTIHPKVWTDVQYVIGLSTQDFENPSHLKSIWAFVKKAAGMLSTVSGAASAFLPGQYKAGALAVSGISGVVASL